MDFIARIDVAQIQRVLKRYNLEVMSIKQAIYNLSTTLCIRCLILIGKEKGIFPILRRDREMPIKPWKDSQGDKYRGRPITLPVVLNNDLSRLESNTYGLKTFKVLFPFPILSIPPASLNTISTGIQSKAVSVSMIDQCNILMPMIKNLIIIVIISFLNW